MITSSDVREVRWTPCENFDSLTCYLIPKAAYPSRQQALRWSSFFAWSSSHPCIAALGIYWRTARSEGCEYLEQIRIELTFASNDLMAAERLCGWPYPKCVGDRINGNVTAVYKHLIAFSFISSLVLALVGSRVTTPSNR